MAVPSFRDLQCYQVGAILQVLTVFTLTLTERRKVIEHWLQQLFTHRGKVQEIALCIALFAAKWLERVQHPLSQPWRSEACRKFQELVSDGLSATCIKKGILVPTPFKVLCLRNPILFVKVWESL